MREVVTRTLSLYFTDFEAVHCTLGAPLGDKYYLVRASILYSGHRHAVL